MVRRFLHRSKYITKVSNFREALIEKGWNPWDWTPWETKLIDAGYATEEQMRQAFTERIKTRLSLNEALEKITEKQIPPKLLHQYRRLHLFELMILYGVESVDLQENKTLFLFTNNLLSSAHNLVDSLIPFEMCRRYRFIPLVKRNKASQISVVVAMVNPDDLNAQDSLNSILKREALSLQRLVITPEDYELSISELERLNSSGQKFLTKNRNISTSQSQTKQSSTTGLSEPQSVRRLLNLYQFKRHLGSGSFGEVSLVHHPDWNIELAVKKPKPNVIKNFGGIDRFEEEAKTWVDLKGHPNVVTCYYVRREGNIPLIFLEYLEGGTLQHWIGNRKLYKGGKKTVLKRILDIAIQVASGLHHAHAHQLIHQDVKSSNVMMTADGRAKVTDFGLANARFGSRFPEQKDAKQTLVATCVGGTPTYFSPEQVRKELLTLRTDVWSWAVLVMEMFMGDLVWQIGSVFATVFEHYYQIQKNKSRQIDSDIPEIPQAVADLLKWCFQERESDRPHNMSVIIERLQQDYQSLTKEYYSNTRNSSDIESASDLNNQALSLLDLGKVEKALEKWQQALEIEINHPETIYNLRVLEYRKKAIDSDLFLDYMQKMHQSNRSNRSKYLLGLAHAEIGEHLKTRKLFEEIKSDVDDTYVTNRTDDPSISLSRKIQEFEGSFQSTCKIGWPFFPSADGFLIFGVISDREMRLSDTKTGRIISNFAINEQATAVCLSRYGEIAISGHQDGSLQIWNTSNNKCLHKINAHTRSITFLSISASNKYLLSVSHWEFKVWVVFSGRFLGSINRQVKNNLIGFDRNGRVIIPNHENSALEVWDFRNGSSKFLKGGHTGKVNALRTSQNGLLVISSGTDNTLKVWDIKSSGTDNNLKFWNIQWGNCIKTISADTSNIISIGISDDGNTALSVNSEREITHWHIKQEHLSYKFQNFKYLFYSSIDIAKPFVYLNEDGTLGIIGCPTFLNNPSVTNQTDARSLNLSRKIQEFEGSFQFAYETGWPFFPSADGSLIFGVISDREMRLSDTKTGRIISNFAINEQATAVCLSGNGEIAISGHQDGSLQIWNTSRKKFLRAIDAHEKSITSLRISANNRYLLSTSYKEFKVWSIRSGEFLGGINLPVESNLVCFDRYGRLITSSNGDGILKIWSFKGNPFAQILSTSKIHGKRATAVEISADGNLVIVGEEEGALIFWSLESNQYSPILKIPRHQGKVNCIYINNDSSFVVSGSTDKTVKLWRIQSETSPMQTKSASKIWNRWNNIIALIEQHQNANSSLSQAENIPQSQIFEGHEDSVTSVYLIGGSYLILSGSQDKTLKLWDARSGQCLKTFEGHKSAITSIAITSDGRVVMSGSKDGSIKLWNINSGQCLKTFEGHTAAITSIAITSDNRVIVSGSKDGSIKLWNIDSGQCSISIENHSVAIVSLDIDSHSERFSSIDEKGNLKLWDLKSGWLLGNLFLTERELSIACLNMNKNLAIIITENRNLVAYNFDYSNVSIQTKIYQGHAGRINALEISPNGKLVISSSTDNTLKIWNIRSGSCVKTISADTRNITSIKISDDGCTTLLVNSEGEIIRWDIKQERPSYRLHNFKSLLDTSIDIARPCVYLNQDSTLGIIGYPTLSKKQLSLLPQYQVIILHLNHISSFQLAEIQSVDDFLEYQKLLLNVQKNIESKNFETAFLLLRKIRFDPTLAYEKQAFKLWQSLYDQLPRTQLKTARKLYNIELDSPVRSICLSLNGETALSGHDDGSVRLWDVSSGKCLRRLYGHSDRVNAISISTNGGFAVSGSNDETLRLWDINSGQCLDTIQVDGGGITATSMSLDNRVIVSSSMNGNIDLWSIELSYNQLLKLNTIN
ncbi:MAG: protein kinase, partial [Spirulina sp.]